MRVAHTVEAVRQAEAELMKTVSGDALMQRAAHGLATICADYLGAVYGARVAVLAGSGHNGGDALFAGARLGRRGARVDVVTVGSSVHEGGLAAVRRAGGHVVPGASTEAAGRVLRDANLVIDGILGIGGRPGLRDDVASLVAQARAPIVAVDVPSGIEVDTGRTDGPHVQADVTVTFGTGKVGLYVDPAASAAGVVELVDIGVQPYLGAPAVEVLQAADVHTLLPWPSGVSHKYTRGVVGVVAGSPQYTGAGVLVVAAALATGLAGMVRYEGASADLVRASHPEVVVGPGRVQAWVVGSGLGDRRDMTSHVASVLADRMPTVVDADGLAHLPDRLGGPAVLTPHAGELAGLLDVSREQVEASMLESALEAAWRWDAVVLLKGARTVIANPDGRIRVNHTGTSWLATAGAGDVLSGVVGTLLAAGLEPFDAASVGAWLHGSAAALASAGGPIAATDVVASLPAALRGVLAGRA